MNSSRRLLLAFLAASFTACGGGGDAAQAPATSANTIAVATVASSGGPLTLADGTVVGRIGAGFVGGSAEVKLEWVPNTEPNALASSAARISIPREALGLSDDATLTVYFRPEAPSTASKSDVVRDAPAKLTEGIDLTRLHARVRSSFQNAAALIPNVVWDQAMRAYAVPVRLGELRSAWATSQSSQIAANVAQPDAGAVVEWIVDIRLAVAGPSPTPRRLYRWAASDTEPDLRSPDRDRIPLVLVHGIQVLPGDQCGAATAYRDTWAAFANRFLAADDEDLRSRYELYTFRYPTEESIAQNGRSLAQQLSERFGNRPVVVVAHSMGGLVTRAADVLYSTRSARAIVGEAFDIDLRRVVTLDTPHLGTPEINGLAMYRHALCADVQGAKDLAWSELAFTPGGSTQPNCLDPNLNPFLCDDARGINRNTSHLERYVAYSGSFDLPATASIAVNLASQIFASLVTPLPGTGFANLTAVASLSECVSHPIMCIPRAGQIATQSRISPEARRSAGDGAVLIKSQRMQTWDGTRWIDAAGFRRWQHFDGIDHLQIHTDVEVFRTGLKPDLLRFASEIGGATIPTTPTTTTPTMPTVPAVPPLIAPNLISPIGNTIVQSLTPTLQWSGGSAVYWQVNIRNIATNALVPSSPLPPSQTTYVVPAGVLVGSTAYRWDVTACPDAACSNPATYVVSADGYFTTPVTLAVPRVAGPIAPGSATSPGPVVQPGTTSFGWNFQNEATSFNFELTDLDSPSVPLRVVATGTSTTVATPAGKRYRWTVAACNSAGCSSPSAPYYFQVATPTSPDLIVSPSTFSPSSVAVRGLVSLQLNIQNRGSAPSFAATALVRMVASNTNSAGPDLFIVNIPPLNVGAVSSQYISLLAPSLPGQYYIWVLLDAGTTSGELGAALLNNQEVSTSSLVVVGQPSLGSVSPAVSQICLATRRPAVNVRWDAIAGATEYVVLRNGVMVYVGPVVSGGWIDDTLQPGTLANYGYRVYARSGSGDGPISTGYTVGVELVCS